MSKEPLSTAEATQILLSNMLVNCQQVLHQVKDLQMHGAGCFMTPVELIDNLKKNVCRGIPQLSEALLGSSSGHVGEMLFDTLFKGEYKFPNKHALKLINAVTDDKKYHIPIMTSDATLEGEGPEIGKPTILTRIAGCAVRCIGCDTPHSWNAENTEPFDGVIDASQREFNRLMHITEISDLLVQQAGYYGLKRISITGGEPLHYVDALRLLVADLWLRGFYLNIETSGVVFDPIIFAMCHVSVDIKTPSSRVELTEHQLGALHAVASYEHSNPAHIKAVIASTNDLEFLVENFSGILNGKGKYRQLCLTPWAHATTEDLDVPYIATNVGEITQWIFDNKRRIDSQQVRVIAQQHKLLTFV